jgi:hypothetical protein
MPPSGMWRRVGVVKTDVSEEQSFSQLLTLFFARVFTAKRKCLLQQPLSDLRPAGVGHCVKAKRREASDDDIAVAARGSNTWWG